MADRVRREKLMRRMIKSFRPTPSKVTIEEMVELSRGDEEGSISIATIETDSGLGVVIAGDLDTIANLL